MFNIGSFINTVHMAFQAIVSPNLYHWAESFDEIHTDVIKLSSYDCKGWQQRGYDNILIIVCDQISCRVTPDKPKKESFKRLET